MAALPSQPTHFDRWSGQPHQLGASSVAENGLSKVRNSMEPVFLLSLASRKTAWLAARQQTIAANIANQNTPGYKAVDVAPFQDVMARTRLDMTTTNAAHLALSGTSETGAPTESKQADDFDVTESGNSVGMESEMAKGGEVNREYALTTNLVKSFHSMLMAALKA